MNKEKKTLVVTLALLVVVVAASSLFLLRPQSSGGRTATIQVGDRVIETIALDTAADGSFSIQDKAGLPITFEIKDHAIRFAESDCPDKVCVKSGYLSRDMDIASCLPNQTVLVVESK